METKTEYREKLIIAADDFGIDSQTDKKIIELVQLGKINRVAVIIHNNHLSRQNIINLQKLKTEIDIHLDMPAKKRVSRRGIFQRSFIFLCDYLKNKNKIEKDWNDQIEKFKVLFGRNPDGLNSHQHIHYFPAYFKIALKLCKKHNIPYLRFGRMGIIKNHSFISQILHRLNRKNNHNFSAYNLVSSDFMASLDWIKDIDKFTVNLPAGKTEIVCHPEKLEEYELIKRIF